MDTRERALDRERGPHTGSPRRRGRNGAGALTGGGTDGNERLTAITGLVLIVLLAVIGVTIVQMGQLVSVHLFVGLLPIGPVALKLASTGYRFLRYYTGNADYRKKGPPEIVLRATAPVVVLSTIAVFVSGVILMFEGRAHRDPMLLIHKVSFIVWIAFTAVHVLGHVPALASYIPGAGDGSRAREIRDTIPGLRAPTRGDAAAHPGAVRAVPGARGRAIVVIGALACGLIVALALIPDFGTWS